VIRHYIRAFIFAIAVGLATIILLFAIGAARALAKPKPGRGHTEVCHFAFKRGRLEVTCHEKRRPRPRAHA